MFRLIKNTKGQILIMFAAAALGMYMLLLLLVYVAQFSREKIKLQTAADASALAMATYQARSLNAVSDRNFTLKYPSGTKDKKYPDYSFPGIDQIDESTGYTFASKTNFEEYMKMVSPFQLQQDKFVELYDKLIPKISEDYMLKNDKNAVLYDYYDTPLEFERQKVSIKCIDWEDVSGRRTSDREMVDAWMTADKNYKFSFVRLKKNVSIWNKEFLLESVALAEVVSSGAEVWEEPKPNFKAHLAVTDEKDVLH